MDSIHYRAIKRKDFNDIKRIMDEIWQVSACCNKEKILNNALNINLFTNLLNSSFAKVAELNGKVVGAILGKASHQRNLLSHFKLRTSLLLNYLMFFLRATKKSREEITDTLKMSKENRKLIKAYKKVFDGHIELLVVSKEAQGLGLGRGLLSSFLEYAKDLEKKKIYVYTDTYCNYGFYDKHGFKLVNSAHMKMEANSDDVTLFLYEYEIK